MVDYAESLTNKKLGDLTTNGFVKTSAGDGTLSVDTAGYQPSDADLTSWAAITRAAGFDTFSATPSSANLLALLTDETGTGAAVFGTAPTLATPVINGLPTGTGVDSAATASTLASRDTNGNSRFNHASGAFATFATASLPETLTVASAPHRIYTGSTAGTVTLPVVSTLWTGFTFEIRNDTGAAALTVNSSGGNAIKILAGKTSCRFTCKLITGTSATSWQADYLGLQNTSGGKLIQSGAFAITLVATANCSVTIPSTGGTLNTAALSASLTDTGSSFDFSLPIKVTGDITIIDFAGAGYTLKIPSGTNRKAGTFTLVAGVATVANTSVTANSVIVCTLKTLGGTRAGNPDIVPTAGTGFVATQLGGITDTSTYNWCAIEVN